MNRPATLKDIAEKLHLSITTISKALNGHPDIPEARRNEILDLVEKMNYVPNTMAKSLRNKKTKFIGLVVSDNSNPYYARVIKGVEEFLFGQGYQTLIFNNNEDVKKELFFIKELRSINVAGVILTPALGNQDSVEILKKFKIPYVLANRYLDRNRDNYVIVNDFQAGYIGTKHLLGKRFKKVLFINGNEHISAARERFEGYLSAMNEAGVTVGSDWVYNNGITQENGYKIAKTILKKHSRPFSLMCFSDYVAIGAMKAIFETGTKIPQEVAVMGIDDIDLFSFIHPGLTTVYVPKKELGLRSAELLIGLIKEPEKVKGRKIILEPKLVIRDSA